MKTKILSLGLLLVALVSFGQVTDQDDNTYKTIQIDSQIWMAENLNVSRFRNGDTIFEARSDDDWVYALKVEIPAWCYSHNSTTNGKIYGKLYNLYAVTDPRGLAHVGWHVTTEKEWITLIQYLGGDSVAGGKMKTADSLYWETPNVGATNESGFSALPGGGRWYNGDFYNLETLGAWWSDTGSRSGNHTRHIHNNDKGVFTGDWTGDGLSVRCVKDY